MHVKKKTSLAILLLTKYNKLDCFIFEINKVDSHPCDYVKIRKLFYGGQNMDHQLKISVIVPVYNAEKHLRQCLDSLLDQGIPEDQYEIICINDGSKDTSLSIIKEYVTRHKNVILIDKENEGVSATRNKGLDAARGKYVWFIDADDWVAKDFLGKGAISKLFNEDGKRVSVMLTKYMYVKDGESKKYNDYTVVADALKFEEISPFYGNTQGYIFDRELIEKYGLRFNTNLSYGEDLIFMREFLDALRFEKERDNNCWILQCGGADVCGIYFYRIHDESAMGQLRNRMEKVADSILYRARWSMERYKMEDKPAWYRANYQEYVNLHMQEYMIYYFPALKKPMWAHLKELKEEGLFPSPPPKLGWVKQKSMIRKIQQFVFKHSAFYPVYYMIMRCKFKKAGTA